MRNTFGPFVSLPFWPIHISLTLLITRKHSTGRVFDDCGNWTRRFQIFTINDNEDPVIAGCPADMTFECGPTVNADITAWVNAQIGIIDGASSDYCDSDVATMSDWDGSAPAISCDESIGEVIGSGNIWQVRDNGFSNSLRLRNTWPTSRPKSHSRNWPSVSNAP